MARPMTDRKRGDNLTSTSLEAFTDSDNNDGEHEPPKKIRKRKQRKKEKKQTKPYTMENLSHAVLSVRTGKMTTRGAAKFFMIPRSTLQSRLAMTKPLGVKRPGPDCVLGEKEEETLANIIKWCVRIGAPKNALEIRFFIKEYYDHEKITSPFSDNLPSEGWIYKFLQRHPDLKSKSTEHHSPGRAAVTIETVKCWFRNAYLALKETGALHILLDPKRVWNCDETAFFFNLVKGKVIGALNETAQRLSNGNEKENETVMVCFSASGILCPPFIISTGKYVHRLDPEDENLNVWRACSDRGWMTSVTMLSFLKHFVDYLKEIEILGGENDKVVLFLDGHASHLSYSVTEFCRANGVILYLLPPNSTHVLQPCDCSAMASLKNLWAAELNKYRKLHGVSAAIPKKAFPRLVRNMWDKFETKVEVMTKAFALTGLFPFDSRAPDYSLLISEQRKKHLWMGDESSDWDDALNFPPETYWSLDENTGELSFTASPMFFADGKDTWLEMPMERFQDSLSAPTQESSHEDYYLDEESGFFLEISHQDELQKSADLSLDEIYQQEAERVALIDLTNSTSVGLRKQAKASLPVASSSRRTQQKRRRVTYHLTSDENRLQQIASHGLSDDDNWQCHKCQLLYSDDRGKSAWTSCDQCSNKVHIACISREHKKSQQLSKKLKLKSYSFLCETCCQSKCCN